MPNKFYITKTYKKAFTLLELVVVIGIVGVITAASVVPYNGFIKRSRDARRKIDIEQLRSALELYKSNSDDGLYPTGIPLLVGNYIAKIPTDPQGKPYAYECINDCIDYKMSILLESGSVYVVQAGSAMTLVPTTVPSGGNETRPTSTPSPTANPGSDISPTKPLQPTDVPIFATPTLSVEEIPDISSIPDDRSTPACSECGLVTEASCKDVSCTGGSCQVQSVSCTVGKETNNNCQRAQCVGNDT